MTSGNVNKMYIAGFPIPDFNGVKGRAKLEYRTCVKSACSIYDPYGLCTISNCLYCENCYYKITLENGEVLANTEVDLDTVDSYGKGSDVDDNEILFYDYVPEVDDLFSYLFDDDSKYRIIRKEDNVITYDHVYSTKKMIKGNNKR